MRRLALLLFACLLYTPALADRIVLVPLDNRPAAGQFAQMIGQIGGGRVQFPPYETLGGFNRPGNSDAILAWLEKQDFSDVSALIVSTDMIGYGGLVASRVEGTSSDEATARLRRLEVIARKVRPNTKVFAFTSVMRLAPTALRSNRTWRDSLAKYVAVRQQAGPAPSPTMAARLKLIGATIPAGELSKYDEVRRRNHRVQQELIGMAARSFDYLVVGQDDAQPNGPHVPETQALKASVAKLEIAGKVYFCEGVDQNSSVLVSRALLKAANWSPKVRVVYSDPYGRKKIGVYESKSIQETVRDQILASGARIADRPGVYDYTLYVNTPDRRDVPFAGFVDDLRNEMDQDRPVCVADINFAADGTCDRELFEMLRSESRLMRLAGFASWNTPGNTLGTAIPTTNLNLLAARQGGDQVARETAHKTFILHRIVDDVLFHRQTRPKAYGLIERLPGGAKEESYGDTLKQMTDLVKADVGMNLGRVFEESLKGQLIASNLAFAGIQNVRIFLPWPRAYEMRLEFVLETQQVATASAEAIEAAKSSSVDNR